MLPRAPDTSQLEEFDPAALLLAAGSAAEPAGYLPSPFLFSYLHYKRYNHHPVSPVYSLPLRINYLLATSLYLFHPPFSQFFWKSLHLFVPSALSPSPSFCFHLTSAYIQW